MLALVAFAELATKLDLRWYVFGAQAVNLHGYPRATADVDVTLDLGTLEIGEILDKLRRSKFEPQVNDQAVIAETRVIPVVHLPTRLPMDVVLAGSGLEQVFLDEVVVAKVSKHRIPVLSKENLIVTKLIAGRVRDLEDVRELLARSATRVDHAKVEKLLRVVEEALATDGLVAQYHRMRGRR